MTKKDINVSYSTIKTISRNIKLKIVGAAYIRDHCFQRE